jgi:ubiquinol-cytochrome c reductase iron-sulfur subunit
MLGVPAPYNLEVPPYSFEGDNVIVIGVDQEAA